MKEDLNTIREALERTMSRDSAMGRISFVIETEDAISALTRIEEHDLGTKESGYDSAKHLCEICVDHNIELPKYVIQSANPVGRKAIEDIMKITKRYIAVSNG